MPDFDPYAVLGLERDADAAAVKAAWRRRAKQTHPDSEVGMADFDAAPNFYERVGTQPPPPANTEVPQAAAPSHGRGAIRDREQAELIRPAKRWATNGDVYWQASETAETLPAGFYRTAEMPNIGYCLVSHEIMTDGLVRLPDTMGEEVLDEFKTFWSLRDRFRELGFLHKRGILLWGPPGSGKTATIMLMVADIVERLGGVVIQLEHPTLAAECLTLARRIESKRPIVAILEDLDALVQRWGESQYLALLDGETQVDNIAYVATTNYPERLDRRFVDRPSRFDTIRWIGMPSADARRVYLAAKDPTLAGAELEEWVERTAGFSTAYLRELLILVRAFGRPLDDAIARLDEMRTRLPTNDDAPDRKFAGFLSQQ